MSDKDKPKTPGAIPPSGRPAPRPPVPVDDDNAEATAMLTADVLERVRAGVDAAEERTQMAQEIPETARFEPPARRAPPPRPVEEPEERTQIAQELPQIPARAPARPAPPARPAAAAPPTAPPLDERTQLAQEQYIEPPPRAGAGRGPSGARPAAPPPEERTQIAQEMAVPSRPTAQPKAVLTVLMGPDEGKRFLIGDGVSHVGRALDCDVVLNDSSSSRKHFRIEGSAGRFVLVDLGSENGTCVGGTRVKKAVLEQDDQISVGTTLLHFGHVGAPGPTLAAEPPAPNSPRGSATGKKRAGWVVPTIATVVVLGVGVGVVFTGESLGWWRIFGSAPAPAAAVALGDDAASGKDTDSSGEAAEKSRGEAASTDSDDDSGKDDSGKDDSGKEDSGKDDSGDGDSGDGDSGDSGKQPVAPAETPDAGAVAVAVADAGSAAEVAGDAQVAVAADVSDGSAVAVVDDALAADVLAADGTAVALVDDALAADGAALAVVDDTLAGDAAVAAADDAQVADAVVAVVDDAAGTDAAAVAEADAASDAMVAAATPDVGLEAGGSKADGLLLEAKLLVGEKKLAEAQAKLAEASTAGAPAESVQALAKTIGAASGHKMIFDSQVKALEAKSYTLVLTLAGQIPTDSPYAAESQALVAEATKAQHPTEVVLNPTTPTTPGKTVPVGQGLPEAATPEQILAEKVKTLGQTFLEHVLAKRDDKAIELLLSVEDCTKAAPTYLEECKKEVEAMRAGLETLRKDLKGTAIAEVSDPDKLEGGEEWGKLTVFAVEASITFQPEPVAATVTVIQFAPEVFKVAYPVQVPGEPSASLDRMKGFRMYGSGDFAGAAAFFLRASKDESLSEEDRNRARFLVKGIQTFEKKYAAGLAAADQLRDVAAITALDEALAADRRVASSYQAKIKKTLANMHAHRAATQFQAGRFWEAAKAARKAVQFDRGQAGAKQVLERLATQADALIEKAKSAEASGAKDQAKRALRDAKLIVAPGDPRAGKIQKMLDALGE